MSKSTASTIKHAYSHNLAANSAFFFFQVTDLKDQQLLLHSKLAEFSCVCLWNTEVKKDKLDKNSFP